MAELPEPTVDLVLCKSYSQFKEDLHYHRGNLKKINDTMQSSIRKTGKRDRDMYSQAYRGAFVEVVATWEKFSQDILLEAVEIVTKCLKDQIVAGTPKHPSAESILQKALANGGLAVHRATQQRQMDAVEAYKHVLLKKCTRHMLPIFLGKDGIDKRFMTLFETRSSLSEIITEMGPVSFAFLNKESKENEILQLATPQNIEDLLSLFYGARCVYAHGNADRTFQPGGVLHDFPERDVFLERVGEKPGDLFYIIYKYAKKYGKTAWVYYHNLVNLQRFVLAVAFRLFVAICKWVYDVFQVAIWNFDPKRVETKEIRQEDDFVQLVD